MVSPTGDVRPNPVVERTSGFPELDRQALDALVNQDCEAFAKVLRDRENDTRVCSAGCIYAMMTALPGAKAELLAYHQAAERESGTGVTCAAVAVWGE